MKSIIIIFLISFSTTTLAKPHDRFKHRNFENHYENHQSKCGYNSCHPTKPNVLNVHLVPHTHDDVGWLKTLDQYYYGSRTLTQKAGVQYILDSVIDELVKDPNRRFVYVESAFFEKWWLEQNDQRRHHVKRLVSEGRLEFAGGSWSMNDEATTHYQSIIDQFTWGLRLLNDTFGECGRPKTGWQIDPFGHSREMTNLWAQSGYDGLFLGRVDFQDKQQRLKSKEAEMVWRGSDDIGKPSDLFTGILFNNYAPPPGFCFDVLCDDAPIIDNPKSPEYNVDKMVKKFVDYAKNQASAYKTNNIIMTMGEDFFYQDALMWYKNLDKLIKYVNKYEPSVNLIYSTPSCYLKSLYDSNQKWSTKQDDFFPYASDEHSFWTGYFTSRPTIKYFERRGNNFLQVCKQLYALTNLNEKDKVDLNMLRKAMGVMQHHDAVTGTEQQHVAQDYARMLEEGILDCLITSKEALNKLMSEKPNNVERSKKMVSNYLPMQLCELNITECDVTESSKKFVITVYNPLAHMITEHVRLPVTGESYTIKISTGDVMDTQLLPISSEMTKQLPSRRSRATHELLFYAENILPFGYRSYFIEESPQGAFTPFVSDNQENYPPQQTFSKQPEENEFGDQMSIQNEYIKLNVDPISGLIESVEVKENGRNTTFVLKQELLYYPGMNASSNATYNRPSGAYIFRPNASDAISLGKPVNKVVKGDLVEELHQRFSDWVSQVVRLYKRQSHVEFEWLVGPIPIEDGIGKEVISRFTTDFKTEDSFYTDSNGRQMIKRIINKRPTWNVKLDEPISGNYYPVTSMISIKDKSSKKEMYVLTDRAQGGTSLKDGQVELMVHRRLLCDDRFGVGEPLNETENGVGLVVKGSHYLLISDSVKRDIPIAVESRQLALKKLLRPSIFISPADNLTYDKWTGNRNEFSGLHTILPGNVHILTLEPWKDKSILLRLEHFLTKTDDPADLSKQAMVNLRLLFSGIKILSYRETSLTANQWIEDVNRLEWQTSEEMHNNFNTVYDGNYKPVERNVSDVNKSFPDKDKFSFFDSLTNNAKEKLSDYLKLSFPSEPISRSVNDQDFLIYLQPMEIKTFIIKAEFND